jgi:hypothetical protein
MALAAAEFPAPESAIVAAAAPDKRKMTREISYLREV